MAILSLSDICEISNEDVVVIKRLRDPREIVSIDVVDYDRGSDRLVYFNLEA